jgi:hypothetical protein
MRKLTLLIAALTLFGAGYLLAQTSAVNGPKVTAIAPNGGTQAISLSASPVGINSSLAVRIESVEDGKVVGKLVAKVEGQWVEVKLGN